MSKYLVIAEKKALADAILAAIPGTEKAGKGYSTKGDYTVTWASGHLLTLKTPEDYDENLHKWSLSSLPINFSNWEVKVNDKSVNNSAAEKTQIIGDLLKKSDAVIHAGDPDEEGQLIVDELLRWHHYTGPVYRLATGDTTKASLEKALKHMDDNKKHEPDGWSAYARAVADFMVGINVSRYFTLKNDCRLTVGRVQTPTLGLVVKRQELIEGHSEITYYDVYCNVQKDGTCFTAKYSPEPNDVNLVDGRILDKGYAESIAQQLNGLSVKGTVTKKIVSEAPPLPFDLGSLQSYCSKKFGYSLSATLAITQRLRDFYNAISYNRTDTRYLPENCFLEAPKTVARVLKNAYPTPPVGLDTSIRSKCFNDKNIEAHFAIIPQNVEAETYKMMEDEKNIYLAICDYYLAQFMPNAKKERYKFTAPVPFGGVLEATEVHTIEQGYLVLLGRSEGDDEDDKVKALCLLKEGENDGYSLSDGDVREKKTKPPAYYTQATLNEDMARIAKYVDDEEVKKLLLEKDKDKKQENGSIGTVATRAGIIDGLIKKGFLEEKTSGKRSYLVATPIGKELCRILPEDLVKPNLTARWWVIQEDIRCGKTGPETLQENVLEMIQHILQTEYPKINATAPKTDGSGNSGGLGNCPWCGRKVVEGSRGFGCSGWKEGCKFVIWKTGPKSGLLCKTTFSTANVQKLLRGEKIKKTTLYSDKKGTTFTGYLSLKSEPTQYGVGYDLSFDEPSQKAVGGRRSASKRSRG